MKKVYIISHSHWDREWYLPYEQHHMRLIELVDDLLDIFETNPDFNSFHLDGQTIILDDYLQVRPENRARVQTAIANGKLRIGPFYILQDDFLISSEANVRNMVIGLEESKKWGNPTMLGYFPDTFGNMGQTPQMMTKAGISAAAYGRGVKPIGFDNEVLADDAFTSQYSEMKWQGPDGTEIFGLLFANWYSNGNEIPAEKAEAIKFWDEKLADAEKFASTDHLLMMNGVDHQPVQKNVTAAIALANELYPDYEFIHSNFTDYLAAVQCHLPEDLGKVEGELTSQETDGWFTLANTASARVYLKQWNTRVERQLENVAEPLAAMAHELTGDYPHDQLTYAWKTLLQNHPHDSICGCSVDEVHREMMPRFEKAYEVGRYVAEESLKVLAENIDTSAFPPDSKPFFVVNTTGSTKTDMVTIDIEIERLTYQDSHQLGLKPHENFLKVETDATPTFKVINENGEVVAATISAPFTKFGYDLPKEAFRVAYNAKYVTVQLHMSHFAPFARETFALVAGDSRQISDELVAENGRVLENEQVKVDVMANGTLTIYDKETKKTLENQLIFEDVGDMGNEYIFSQTADKSFITSENVPFDLDVLENTDLVGKIKLTHHLKLPKSADDGLQREQEMVTDFRFRPTSRHAELVDFPIETVITIVKDRKRIGFSTQINNTIKDHRLRVLFPTTIVTETHEADSIYEVVKRPNTPSKYWENPTNPQHQHAFVNLHEAENGVTVSNFGLNEYEIVSQNTIALTLIRCVGELGDWGYFPTPEAQCQGDFSFDYGIELHGIPETRYETYKQAQSAQVALIAKQTSVQNGKLLANSRFIDIKGDSFAVTATLVSSEQQLLVRGYNLADSERALTITKNGKTARLLNLVADVLDNEVEATVKAYEIRTIGFD
ncbi:alpha-mannosidase [Lactococcus hodotermopsidis]|uniref:Alpha-mannosidase n=1 Tax=Pseudolactococcus hodotermopsidis TaxID=2709157 RepID=A0A6A0BCE2_9LACT|nr:alpha-mannosidase [Lactococcus hodotermopsidis]GFH42335.1 alpha-mannosidase [Lactococcus hodotermopsidis]